MFRIGICDDECIICSEIESIILNYGKSISGKIEVDIFYSGEELYKYLKIGNSLDMVFLDIELNKLNGIELGKRIREEIKNESIQIVYIFSKENYAMELFEVRPLNFLIKPVDDIKVIKMIDKAMELLNKLDVYFKYKQGHNFSRKEIKDIIYFESDNRQVKMITTTDEIIFYSNLSEIHSQLELHKFFFTHKSYLVNYYHVAEFYYDKLIMTNSHVLPISQSKRAEVRKLQLKHEGDDI
ncbi:MAG: LytTR family DNA-binding domain-containing protein [Sedimentibacter sp.]|uniref:LytR/AlgR family response regulator transcription factor n=1 Tax=Sedimentibacter sp. TaxID=1960295 RepID=UPI0029825397|nr:LytTR family DNA-binding domain-containing protein [Sedimentibacter sp.]MDW5300053.1 LytTR family DNA-binding domain-containing protein [Sedimentibacter sp.]